MAWPNTTDYHGAVQNPRVSLEDEELRKGEIARTRAGLPMVWSGSFADVYKMHCPATGNTWALKCFTREVPGLRERYRKIAAHLERVKLPFTVDFQYLERGIRISGAWFPALKMRWVEGLTLNRFVEEHLDRPKNLKVLLDLWVKLSVMLREAGVAHADLQHGNVLLVPMAGGSLALRLIDYDGMYVPQLAGTRSGEFGHPAFQHPQRLREGTYNAEVDRFSHLVIYSAIRCLRTGRHDRHYLWERFHDDNLLFRESDFRRPMASEVFRRLWALPSASTRALVGRLVLACQRPLEESPALGEIIVDGKVLPLSRKEETAVASLLSAPESVTVTIVPANESGHRVDAPSDIEEMIQEILHTPPATQPTVTEKRTGTSPEPVPQEKRPRRDGVARPPERTTKGPERKAELLARTARGKRAALIRSVKSSLDSFAAFFGKGAMHPLVLLGIGIIVCYVALLFVAEYYSRPPSANPRRRLIRNKSEAPFLPGNKTGQGTKGATNRSDQLSDQPFQEGAIDQRVQPFRGIPGLGK